MLKSICEVLDLERSGVNSELVARILNFLMFPKPSGKVRRGIIMLFVVAVHSYNLNWFKKLARLREEQMIVLLICVYWLGGSCV